jgi:hypothetical protein
MGEKGMPFCKLACVTAAVVFGLGSMQAQESAGPNPPHVAAALMLKRGDIAGAKLETQRALDRDPGDDRSRAMLILTYLKGGEQKEAEAERQNWNKLPSTPERQQLMGRIDALFEQRRNMDALRAQLAQAIHEFNAVAARKAIAESSLAPLQRAALDAWIDVYHGDFDQARAKAAKLGEGGNPAGAALGQQLDQAFAKNAADYASALCTVHWFESIPDCQMPEGLDSGSLDGWFQRWMNQYIDGMTKLLSLAPLALESREQLLAMNLVFHRREEADKLGLQILDAGDPIQLTFGSEDFISSGILNISGTEHTYQVVVIDRAAGTIRTMPLHPSHVEETIKAPYKARIGEQPTFQMKFSEVNAIQQAQKSDSYSCNKSRKTAVLDFGNGRRTYGTFSAQSTLGGMYAGGQLACKQIAWDVGDFVLKMIGRENIKKQMVEVKAGGSSFGMMLGAMAASAAGSAIGAVGLTDMGIALSTINESKAQGAVDAQALKNRWDQLSTDRALTSVTSGAGSELDALIASLAGN